MTPNKEFLIHTMVGDFLVVHDEEEIFKCELLKQETIINPIPTCTLEEQILDQVEKYNSGELKKFDLPLHFKGTPFQIKVWKQILSIPCGKTITYSDIAQKLKSRAYQAIGNSCGKNPFALLVPCHRVKAKNGLGGFFYGLKLKKKWLELEGVIL
ncbi:MAG: methylated-DNA--[protein]-cysteine S-methyltransferase [Halobacteriovoraceae bacterium]|nr:methylated-DNA--[protein]-cysteine S-methyltransferase [Halobacteriovoraceae bacterium]